MIRDINIDNRKIFITYGSSDLAYPRNDLYPSDEQYPTSVEDISNIVQGSIKLDELIADEDIRFGKLYSSMFEVTVFDTPDISGSFLQVYQKDGDIIKNIFSGQVVSCKLDNTGLDRTIVAYDNSYFIRNTNVAEWWTNFWSNRTTATLKECRDSLCTYMNLIYEDVVLPNDNISVEKSADIDYISFNDVISMLCELNACFPHISRDNTLEFIMLDTEEEVTDITGLYEGLNSQFEDFTISEITGIEFLDSDNELKYTYGEKDNIYRLSSNIFTYPMGTEQLDIVASNLLDYISGITYTPANVKMIVGDLDYHLGQRIHTDKGDFYILENQYSASQLIEETIIARGTQERNESIAPFNTSLIINNEKISKVQYDVEHLTTEFADTSQKLSSRINQNAESISTEVTRAGNAEAQLSSRINQTADQITIEVQKGTQDMHATYQGSYVPTLSNYPANQWTTNNLKSKNVGCTFYNMAEQRTYRFTATPNAIQITFSSDSMTENNYDYVEIYCQYNGTWKKTNKFTGGYNNTTNNIADKICIIPTNVFYVVWHSDSSVTSNGFKIDSIVPVYTDNPLQYFPTNSSYSGSTYITLTGTDTKPESSHPYNNNEDITWRWNTQIAISSSGYGWVLQEQSAYSRLSLTENSITAEVSRAKGAENELSSRITVTENGIESKVSKGDVSSVISQESGQITISSNRLAINSDNFTLTKTGTVTISGGRLNLGGTKNGALYVYDENENKRGQWTKAGLIVYDEDGNTKFSAKPSAVTWSNTYSSMSSNGTLTIKRASIQGYLDIGGSNNGYIRLYDSSDNLRGKWDRSQFYINDSSGNTIFKVTSSKATIKGDLNTGDITVSGRYIRYDSNTYIDMQGYDDGVTLNGDSAVFSVDDIHVTKSRNSSAVYTGDSGTCWVKHDINSDYWYQLEFVNGICVGGLD